MVDTLLSWRREGSREPTLLLHGTVSTRDDFVALGLGGVHLLATPWGESRAGAGAAASGTVGGGDRGSGRSSVPDTHRSPTPSTMTS